MKASDFRIPRSSVAGCDDESLCWAVVERIWPDNTVTLEDELAHIAQGTVGQQAVYSTMLFAQEVDNGGLQQFFGNSSGLYWQHVVSGLELLGAGEHLAALSVALNVFPTAQPAIDQGERRVVLDKLDQRQKIAIRAAEDAIYQSGGFEGTLVPLWKRYIESHPEQFFLD